MNGYGKFSHRVVIKNRRLERFEFFNEVRVWCWETFGPSTELSVQSWLAKPSEHWSWRIDTRDDDCYIYFKTEDDLSFFKLRFGI
jgi:hypothetical protein